MKDYLEEQGFIDIKSPLDSIKKSFKIELIKDGEVWLKALVDRNLAAHTYEESFADEIDMLIRAQYYKLLKDFRDTMLAL